MTEKQKSRCLLEANLFSVLEMNSNSIVSNQTQYVRVCNKQITFFFKELDVLKQPSSHILIFPLRIYEHVSDLGLFLFNDALVLTEKSVSNVPFCLAVNTTHTFLASVALHCLNLTEMADTKCMCYY